MNPTIPNGSESSQSAIPPLLTVAEVAKVLRISTRSVWRLVNTGKLIKPVRIGGSIRWRRTDLENWIVRGCPEDGQPLSTKISSPNQMIEIDDQCTIKITDATSTSDQSNDGG